MAIVDTKMSPDQFPVEAARLSGRDSGRFDMRFSQRKDSVRSVPASPRGGPKGKGKGRRDPVIDRTIFMKNITKYEYHLGWQDLKDWVRNNMDEAVEQVDILEDKDTGVIVFSTKAKADKVLEVKIFLLGTTEIEFFKEKEGVRAVEFLTKKAPKTPLMSPKGAGKGAHPSPSYDWAMVQQQQMMEQRMYYDMLERERFEREMYEREMVYRMSQRDMYEFAHPQSPLRKANKSPSPNFPSMPEANLSRQVSPTVLNGPEDYDNSSLSPRHTVRTRSPPGLESLDINSSTPRDSSRELDATARVFTPQTFYPGHYADF